MSKKRVEDLKTKINNEFYSNIAKKGVELKQDKKDLTEMKQFKESDNLVQQMNQGIKPKLVLFMPVRNEIRFH